MPLTADQLIDRKRLKSRLAAWRLIALLSVFGAAAFYAGRGAIITPVTGEYIAEIGIEGVLEDDRERDAMLKELAESPYVKAVIVRLDSPGGTAVAGEEIYLGLRAIAAQKPVIGVMRTLCASACYMAALGTDAVIAREGTLTGSIGVLMQSVEISRLADKLGITPITVKSGPYKDVPSLGEPFTETQREVVAAAVNDAYDHFIRLIIERRKFDDATARNLADGRVYTGNQAFRLRLIDGIGGQEEALDWLQKQHKISPKLEVREVEPNAPIPSLFENLRQYTGIKFLENSTIGLDGLVSIWHPSPVQ